MLIVDIPNALIMNMLLFIPLLNQDRSIPHESLHGTFVGLWDVGMQSRPIRFVTFMFHNYFAILGMIRFEKNYS